MHNGGALQHCPVNTSSSEAVNVLCCAGYSPRLKVLSRSFCAPDKYSCRIRKLRRSFEPGARQDRRTESHSVSTGGADRCSRSALHSNTQVPTKQRKKQNPKYRARKQRFTESPSYIKPLHGPLGSAGAAWTRTPPAPHRAQRRWA